MSIPFHPKFRADFFVFVCLDKVMELTLDWLKANCEMIHYFGLGFIQLKLDKTQRLHFYTKHLPPIVPEEDVHNHRYDFNSKIMSGTLVQEIFEVIPGETHTIEEESCQVGVKVESTAKPCKLRLASMHTYHKNSEYFISHETFHRVSYIDHCITLLARSGYKKNLAQVIRPVGQEHVCPFSQKVPEERLWEIVEEMVS